LKLKQRSPFFRGRTPIIVGNQDAGEIDNFVPTVIFAGQRHMYLQHVVNSLRNAFTNAKKIFHHLPKPVCIFYFDIPTYRLDEGTAFQFCNAIDVAESASDFCELRIRINIYESDAVGHRHMKLVWLDAMRYIWEEALPVHMGDIVFIEDDSVPAPDFFQVVSYLSSLKKSKGKKNITNEHKPECIKWPQVIAMGGWGGENTIMADPNTVMQKTFQWFPTMGYGFDRELWRVISKLKRKIKNNRENDWSSAVAFELWNFGSTDIESNIPCKRVSGFMKNQEVEVFQPTQSRIWHIGEISTLGGIRTVQESPPWEMNATVRSQNGMSLFKGRFDWFGFPCEYRGRPPDCCDGRYGKLFPSKERFSLHFIPN
jgi:hypothetical protein